jgi:hypothetical protein
LILSGAGLKSLLVCYLPGFSKMFTDSSDPAHPAVTIPAAISMAKLNVNNCFVFILFPLSKQIVPISSFLGPG